MNRYIMLNHGIGLANPNAVTLDKWEAYIQLLQEKDYFVGGSSLDHGIALKDGLYGAPVTPALTGYILIQAESMEVARSLAWQSPLHHAGGTVEVFKLVEN